MPSGIFYPDINIAGDTRQWRVSSASGFGEGAIYFGSLGAGNARNSSSMFRLVNIPPRSKIVSAFVRFNSSQNSSNTVCNVTLHFERVGDAVSPTTWAEAIALVLTQGVSWDAIAAWVAEVDYDTPELRGSLQEVVDLSNWVFRNSVQIVIHDNSSTDAASRSADSIGASTGTKDLPELHVTWKLPSRIAGEVSEQLLRRVREEGGLGTTQDFAIQTLSHCQRIVNAGLRSAVESNTLTTKAKQLIYSYRDADQLPNAVDIISIKDGNRTLQRVTSLAELCAYDTNWFRATGKQHDVWLQLGRDLLIIYPAKTADSTLTVNYSLLTEEFVDYAKSHNVIFDLPQENVDIALGLSEVILLLRSRMLPEAQKRMETLMGAK